MGRLSKKTEDTSMHYSIEHNLNCEEMMLVLEERVRRVHELHRELRKQYEEKSINPYPEVEEEYYTRRDHYLHWLDTEQSRLEVCFEKYMANYRIVLKWDDVE